MKYAITDIITQTQLVFIDKSEYLALEKMLDIYFPYARIVSNNTGMYEVELVTGITHYFTVKAIKDQKLLAF